MPDVAPHFDPGTGHLPADAARIADLTTEESDLEDAFLALTADRPVAP